MDSKEQDQLQSPLVNKPPSQRNVWMVIAIILFIILIGGGAYFLGKSQTAPQNTTLSQPTVSPTLGISPTALPKSPTGIPSVSEGTVSGKLCYPSSLLPPGKIVAKSTTTNELFTQEYPGSQNGGSMIYNFVLKPDTYHIKYDASGPSNNAVSGYYTDYSSCVGAPYDPNNTSCSGQKTRPLLPVKVEAGSSVKDVNLCDFYYPPDNPPQF